MKRAALTLAVVLAASALPMVPAQAAAPCFGRAPTIEGTRGHDVLRGTDGPDVIVGNGGVDIVRALGGNDRICLSDGEAGAHSVIRGGGGADHVDAGAGDSTVFGGGGRDLVFGGEGEDHLYGGSMGDAMFGGAGVDYLFGHGGHDELRGGESDDVVHGYDGDDTLDGGAGTDQVFFTELCCANSYDAGGVRVDLTNGTARAADGRDSVAGFEVLHGSKGDDHLIGSDAAETIHGLDGNDVLDGLGGDDELIPDDPFEDSRRADDDVDGGPGADTVGYRGYDPMTVDLSQGAATGPNKGRDSLLGIENVVGGWARDRLVGDDGDNVIVGDFLGGGANDFLDGRGGTDTLDGRGGDADTCLNGEVLSNCE